MENSIGLQMPYNNKLAGLHLLAFFTLLESLIIAASAMFVAMLQGVYDQHPLLKRLRWPYLG